MDMAAAAAANPTGLPPSSHSTPFPPAGWQWHTAPNGAGTPTQPLPPPPHHQSQMSFDTVPPNAPAMAAFSNLPPPPPSIAQQQQGTIDSSAYYHQQQLHLQQQHSALQAANSPSMGMPQATAGSSAMPSPYNCSPIRAIFPAGGTHAAVHRMPHPLPAGALMPPRPHFPSLQPRFGLFVFPSESANRAVVEVRRTDTNGLPRWNSMCAWHMAHVPLTNPFAMCRQGPSTSAAASLPPPGGNCAGMAEQGNGAHLSPMNPPPTGTKSSSGGGRGGTKRKALAQGASASETRHKSVSTPSPHFHSPLPQPLSVPADVIVGNNWAAPGFPGGGAHPASTPMPLDVRRVSSTSGEFPPPTGPPNNGGEMCPTSAATTLNGYSDHVLNSQQNNSPLIVKPPPAGINNMAEELLLGDDPLKRLELMTNQSLCDMPLGNHQQLAPSSKTGLPSNDSVAYAAAVAEQRSKEQKLARLEQISQCLSSSDLSPPFAGGELVNGGSNDLHPANFRAPQLMPFPHSGGMPPTSMGHFQHPAAFPPGMAAMRIPHPHLSTMQPVPPYTHNPHITGPRQLHAEHHMYGGDMPPHPPQHQMNGGNMSAGSICSQTSPNAAHAMSFPHPGLVPPHLRGDLSPMMTSKDGMMQRRCSQDGLYPAGNGFPGPDDSGGMMMSTNCWPQQHQMPQPLTNLDARVPVKQMQYYPNSAMNNGGGAE